LIVEKINLENYKTNNKQEDLTKIKKFKSKKKDIKDSKSKMQHTSRYIEINQFCIKE